MKSTVYKGSKAKHLDFILPLLPMTPRYVEPFGGSAAVLLNRPRSEEEVYNDLYRPMAAFMAACRDEPDRMLRTVTMTPHSRRECMAAVKALRRPKGRDPLDLAAAVAVVGMQGFSGKMDSFGRLLQSRGNGSVWSKTPDVVDVSDRLQGVAVENRDAVKVLLEYDSPDTLTYLDPPYVDADAYKTGFEPGDQRRLADALESIEGLAAVSGYESDLYEELYPASKGWVKYVGDAKAVLVNNNPDSGSGRTKPLRVETVWTNYQL